MHFLSKGFQGLNIAKGKPEGNGRPVRSEREPSKTKPTWWQWYSSSYRDQEWENAYVKKHNFKDFQEDLKNNNILHFPAWTSNLLTFPKN